MTLRQCLLTLAAMAAAAFVAGAPREVTVFLVFAFGVVAMSALPLPSSVWTDRRDARRRGAR